VGRFPLVVPKQAGCPNPGCAYTHRISALVDRVGTGDYVEGEVFEIDEQMMIRLDALENYLPQDHEASAFLRRTIDVRSAEDWGTRLSVEVYFVANGPRYTQMVEEGYADMVSRYTLAMAAQELKPCCVRDPGHAGEHDGTSVVLPMDGRSSSLIAFRDGEDG
jgi:gamma-glutamylcyclotransferase (GGCT)/AIG2-like uncharacterized protein YtfP